MDPCRPGNNPVGLIRPKLDEPVPFSEERLPVLLLTPVPLVLPLLLLLLLLLALPLPLPLDGQDRVSITIRGLPRRGYFVAYIPGPFIIISKRASRSCIMNYVCFAKQIGKQVQYVIAVCFPVRKSGRKNTKLKARASWRTTWTARRVNVFTSPTARVSRGA